jgi:anti-anti-sigma regulatory factor
MARIRVTKQRTTTCVVVVGRLQAADVRRLEYACGPALMAAQADLIVDLTHVSDVDKVAAAVLGHMASRGPIIRRAE